VPKPVFFFHFTAVYVFSVQPIKGVPFICGLRTAEATDFPHSGGVVTEILLRAGPAINFATDTSKLFCSKNRNLTDKITEQILVYT